MQRMPHSHRLLLLARNRPLPREGHAMAYDRHRKRAVLFSQWRGNGYLRDTWLRAPAIARHISKPLREGLCAFFEEKGTRLA